MEDRTGRYLAIALALGLVAYANSLGNGFTFDDLPIVVKNPLVRTCDLGRHLSSSYWPDRPEFGLYRPLTVLSYSVNYWLGGMAPGGYHAVNLVVHLLNGAMAFFLALRILGSAPAAGLVAATFLLHPVQTEAVGGGTRGAPGCGILPSRLPAPHPGDVRGGPLSRRAVRGLPVRGPPCLSRQGARGRAARDPCRP